MFSHTTHFHRKPIKNTFCCLNKRIVIGVPLNRFVVSFSLCRRWLPWMKSVYHLRAFCDTDHWIIKYKNFLFLFQSSTISLCHALCVCIVPTKIIDFIGNFHKKYAEIITYSSLNGRSPKNGHFSNDFSIEILNAFTNEFEIVRVCVCAYADEVTPYKV